jgi:hypothetical protein
VAWIRFFQGRAVLDEMEPEARALTLGTDLGRRQPDLGHERATGQLGEHAGVDLVGLGGERCQAAHALGIGDQDLPAGELERVVDEARAVHGFDRRPDGLVLPANPPRERSQRVRVGRDGRHQRRRAVLAQHVHVEPLSRQVQSGVQHWWASSVLVA